MFLWWTPAFLVVTTMSSINETRHVERKYCASLSLGLRRCIMLAGSLDVESSQQTLFVPPSTATFCSSPVLQTFTFDTVPSCLLLRFSAISWWLTFNNAETSSFYLSFTWYHSPHIRAWEYFPLQHQALATYSSLSDLTSLDRRASYRSELVIIDNISGLLKHIRPATSSCERPEIDLGKQISHKHSSCRITRSFQMQRSWCSELWLPTIRPDRLSFKDWTHPSPQVDWRPILFASYESKLTPESKSTL